MKRKRQACVITGTRAEYGLLYWLMKGLQSDPEFQLQIIATCMHLSPEFGLTYRSIERDGFTVDEKVENLLSSDTPVGIAKSIGLATIGFADAYVRLKPDFIIMLGDRFELLAAAQAALVARIPVVHLSGGDLTEGAVDESIRHSITKMAHVHFVSNELSARRVRQMGENPAYIFNVGNPGLDYIRNATLMSRPELEQSLGFTFRAKNLLVTFHPVTLDNDRSAAQCEELLKTMDLLGTDVGVIFTEANADTHGRIINEMVKSFVASHPACKVFPSLGQLRYLSTVAQVDAVVGNSSSGLVEVPSLHKPTVNIGDRQKGRLLAASVIPCDYGRDSIASAIRKAFVMDCSGVVNPYGDGRSTPRIIEQLKKLPDPLAPVKKPFFDLGSGA